MKAEGAPAPAHLGGSPRDAAPPEGCDRTELFDGAVRCWQPTLGYRFSVDALLLAMAAFDPPPPPLPDGQTNGQTDGQTDGASERSVLELGTGVGVVLLVLALNSRFERLVGLEIQPTLAALARRNAREAEAASRLSTGRLATGRIDMITGDLCAPPSPLDTETFDLVVSNPPYYPVGAGRLNPNAQRATARHEIACRLADVLARAHASVRPGGRVLLVYPAPRAKAVLDEAPAAGLTVTDIRFVRSREGYPARQVLVGLTRPVRGKRQDESRPTDSPVSELPVPELPTLDLHDERGEYVGPLADFFRTIARLGTTRATDE